MSLKLCVSMKARPGHRHEGHDSDQEKSEEEEGGVSVKRAVKVRT